MRTVRPTRSWKPFAAALLALGLAAPAAHAQRELGLSIGTSGVSFGARLGSATIHLSRAYRDHGGSHARIGYVSSRRHSSHARVWVPGCYDTVPERVWIPARREKRWIEPVYETRRDSCGRPVRVLVRPGCWRWVEVPGHYETRAVKRWVPGHWSHR